MDWMYDELFDGKRIWILTVVDTWSQVCLVMRVWVGCPYCFLRREAADMTASPQGFTTGFGRYVSKPRLKARYFSTSTTYLRITLVALSRWGARSAQAFDL